MAKENLVSLHGQLVKAPQIYVTSENKYSKGLIYLKTLRRPIIRNGVIASSRLYFDCPIILTKNEALIKKFFDLNVGDMIDVKGALSTQEVIKTTVCPQCGNKNSVPGNSVFVTPIYVCRREQGLSPEDGIRILKERCEVSNTVAVIGTLCRDPEGHEDDKGQHYARYQLAVNRKYHIKEDDPSIKTDYPWVKTFGNQALEDSKGLRMSSVVYINGALQTREIERLSTCEHCGAQYKWKETVTEIVPYSTEYLSNCIVPEERGEANGEGKSKE